MVNPSLPQGLSPEELYKRKEELQKNQALYTYESPDTIPAVAFIKGPVDKLPGQSPTFWYKLKVIVVQTWVSLNFAGYNPGRILNAVRNLANLFVNQNDSNEVQKALKKTSVINDPKPLAEKALKRIEKSLQLEISTFDEHNPVYEPYRDMYRLLRLPPIANNFLDDSVFARLRIAGYNPLSLFRVMDQKQMPFHIDEAQMPNDGDRISHAIREKRLYALDHSFIGGLKQKQNSEMILVPVKALFVIPPGGGDLWPLAIELPNEVVYPPRQQSTSNFRWTVAKLAVNNADALHHELIAHLGRTHLLVEPFVAATMRQLPSNHPLHVLLTPHFEGTVFINDAASTNLVAPGGNVDKIFGGDITDVMKWAGQQVVDNKFNESMPDVEMKNRGVDSEALYFPYREDALEHFAALHDWVHDYLSYYYTSDHEVKTDMELQRWVEELVDPKRGRVADFGEGGSGRIRTVAYLARAVTFVIFSASVQHASVNFPQRILMTFAPAVAGALWTQIPSHDQVVGVSWWRNMLTPLTVALEQVQFLSLLGGVYYTKLGNYRRGEIPKDRAISNALNQYRKKLAKIDSRIKQRERKEMLPYEYMRPGNIPQSINI